jgi:sec-independent protein translocase protein TatB
MGNNAFFALRPSSFVLRLSRSDMFELSFGKMMIIAVVALIVLGPEKLPKVARTLGHLLGRARSYANQVKQDIDREMQMDELRKLQEQAKDAARSFETAVNDAGRSVEAQAAEAEQSFNAAAAEAQNSIAPPTHGKPAEIDALEKSIAEQAAAANASSADVKPIVSAEQMNSPLAPAWPGVGAANSAKASAAQKVA